MVNRQAGVIGMTKVFEKMFDDGIVVNFLLRPAAVTLMALMFIAFNASAAARAGVIEDIGAVRKQHYAHSPEAPARQTAEQAEAKSQGCLSCHLKTDAPTMHMNSGVTLGCTDCHGGDAGLFNKEGSEKGSPSYQAVLNRAHVQPLYPEAWRTPASATPQQTYSLLNLESPEFIRFINPGDYRVARESCGACHLQEIQAAERSMMATGAMLWGGAAYNNGILPFKRYVTGEFYVAKKGEAALAAQGGLITEGAILKNAEAPDPNMQAKGVLPLLAPMPAWESIPPGDVFRAFERGGRLIGNLFPETGLPNVTGQMQRLDEPGRPDTRQSNRGPATGARIAVPVINIHKTRLNDPFTWFFGTNDQPGDYRSSGCSACHVVYSNDRDPSHSGPYAKFGHDGTSISVDPTLPKGESGHPLKHEFSRAIPSSTCMICHMHQPNSFINTFLGYIMWDYESDAPNMWPKKQRYVSDWDTDGVDHDPDQILGHRKTLEISRRNPEEAAQRGLWGDVEFLKKVWDNNGNNKDTQFADYHGHGWNFRAVYKRDRKGHLLDQKGNRVADDDPNKFQKAVHMASIHVDKGMHCVDCHFEQDAHGNGHLYGEVAQAVEIECVDCHGTVDRYPALKTSGPSAPPGGTDLSLLRTQDGRARFEWRGDKLYQRSALWPDKEWEVALVKDSVNPDHPKFNPKAARAKTIAKDKSMTWGPAIAPEDRAHRNEEMTCYTCHTSWTTSCGGCHLSMQANWKTRRHHYDFDETRNYATYNPQVARDEMFQLGRHGPAKGGRIAPVRSSSALVLSSRNANRELLYVQQAPISSSGFSSQAFAPHYPHTERKTETKACTDCHVSTENDNNAILAQLLLQGTNFVNFVGLNAWVGSEDAVEAVRVTEWDEPQAVIGSFLHQYAYPDWYKRHLDNGRKLQEAYRHATGPAHCLQLRGEYLYVAEGDDGMRVYDVAGIANKGISQRIMTAPVSPLGQNTRIASKNATCVVLPTNQPIHPDRRTLPRFGMSGEKMHELISKTNLEQEFHPIYNYAFITDAEEGLILTDVNTLADGEPRNNFLERALTWNDHAILKGARHLTIGGRYFYIAADVGIVVLDMNEPLKPKVDAVIPLHDARASALQFRYLFVTDAEGLKVVDVTDPAKPRLIKDASVPFKQANRVYVARTYAYVAADSEGLAIVDVEKPEQPKLYRKFTAGGQINDVRDVIVGTTNASLFAYIADGKNGLKVVQLTSPDSQPGFYGFSPEPRPELIASYATDEPALALSKGLDRDRAVDETGGQIAVLGRIGARPFIRKEMEKLYLNTDGKPWTVTDEVEMERLKRR